MQAALAAPLALLAAAWLWFLARGRARGAVKRAALRLTLLAFAGRLVAVAAQRGLFVRASFGFRAAILVAMLTVVVGYLYLIRFCVSCGRMVRNLRDATCPRCGAFLPRHGMTGRVRRRGDERLRDPLQRRRHASDEAGRGPRA
jgi:predicted RNA-binding Zn-ribbon protein involved in translation (DUF1610 family)